MEEEKKYTKNNIIISFLIGVLIGFGSYYLYDNVDAIKNIKRSGADNKIKNEAVTDIDNSEDLYSSNTHQQNKIIVNDQPAGMRVMIESVSMDQVGWVVVREDRNGEFGNILGAQRFDIGSSNGEVELLRNTVEGGTYYAVIYGDDGDMKFDYEKDTPILSDNEEPIFVEFKAIRIR